MSTSLKIPKRMMLQLTLLISIRMLESQWVRQIVGGYGFCKIAGSTESCGPLSALFAAALMDGEILVKRGGASSSGSCTSRYLNSGISDVSTVIFILPLIGYDTPLHSCSSATSTKLRLQFPHLYRQLQLKRANVSTNSVCLRRETKQLFPPKWSFHVDGLLKDFLKI